MSAAESLSAAARSRSCACLLAALAIAAGTRAHAQDGDGFPGMALKQRAEQRIELERYTLKEQSLGHYGLVFPIQPRELHAFMGHIVIRGTGDELVPGGVKGPELHGGAVLAFLLDHWRPHGRPARLDDAYPFASPRREIPLRDLDRAHRSQVFLPESGAGGLARMHYRLPSAGGEPQDAEVDAYRFLGTLVAGDGDGTRTWTNRRGQTLSTERLLRRAWEHYLGERSPDAEVADHGNLHLVELLLAYNRQRLALPRPTAPELDSNRIKERFLAVELRRDDFPGSEGRISLVHYVESLGRLLQDPHVRWAREEQQQVRAWLAGLGERLEPLEALPPYLLSHLVRGLRWVDAFRSKLGGSKLGG